MHSLACLAVLSGLLLAPSADSRKDSALPEGLRLQPGDAIAKPIDPVEKRSADEEQQLDALALFGLGKLHENRGEFREALAAYRRAAEIAPEEVAIYRRLVPLEFNLGENEQGIEHALKLVELAPDDVGLMQQLSQVLVARGQIARAIALLEKALQGDSVEHFSAQNLALHRDLGVLYAATGDNAKAAKAFELLFEGLQNPARFHLGERQLKVLLADDPETIYEQLGETFLSVEKTDLAIQAFQAAAKAREGKTGILKYNLARVYLADKRPEKAYEQLEQYLDAKRTDRGRAAYDLLKTVYIKLERQEEFIPRLQKLIEQQPENYAAKLVLADELYEREKYEEAETLYKAALKAGPDPTGLMGLARIARKQGRAAEILELLSRATIARATDAVILEELTAIAENTSLTEEILATEHAAAEQKPPETSFASALLAAKLAVQADRIDDATFFFRSAARIRPDRKATILNELGIALMLAEKVPEAIDVLREAIESTSDDATRLNLMFRLAQAQEFDHQTDAALKTIQEALSIAPEVPLLHFQRGWIHFHARHLKKAEELFRQVLKQFPQDADVARQTRLALSALYVQQGDIEQGEAVLEEVYAQNPDDIAVNNDLGYLYADQGKKLEQAESMIRKAVAAEPENAAYLDSLGWVLYKRGRFEEALSPLEKAVKLPNGDDATMWGHLGDVYEKLGRANDAQDAWKHALELAREDERPDPEKIMALEAKLKSGDGGSGD